MEVADQWRREWAGTAEFGKVTEGGVTRRIARAMEVLNASGPGARVRVMRAAYHSTAGPGAPAESFMLHSSRRVISSGFNFLEPSSIHIPTKPLEISSTPLELAHISNGEPHNYKVTEPDDLDISEPSKWKSSSRGSIRMPSEESSSTDNASIIDLDSRSHKNLHRKYSYDSESSDIQSRSRSNSRTSPHLDAPSALSTLKYKSLLNNTNEWNTRRKSYSFEDHSPINETITHKNDTIAMESSTDSGICKSTEIMNDNVDDNYHTTYLSKDERNTYNKEESFREWLSKNRQNSQYRSHKFKTYREHEIVLEDPKENNIALQSPGKVSITLPVTIESDTDDNTKRISQITDDVERRVKKVEFCKTEVHFAAESGKVNIIATDEKPPPSHDFRKRRSAFVPMEDMTERPITLFGDRNEYIGPNRIGTSWIQNNSEVGESDENTAATKSILKNKIPKPKPYLLGENMEFGSLGEVSNKNANDSRQTAKSMVHQQMEPEKGSRSEIKSIFSTEFEKNVMNNYIDRTLNSGPNKNDDSKYGKPVVVKIKVEKAEVATDVNNKTSSLQKSPVPVKAKTRQLRESDLTYFGIENNYNQSRQNGYKQEHNKIMNEDFADNIFQSVKLIQRVSNSVSNSVCNSEPESEESPEYQNLPMNINYAPIPTPRSRSKYVTNEINEVRAALKPIAEKENDNLNSSSRRSKFRRQDVSKASRSISEPPKNFKRTSLQKTNVPENQITRKHQPLHVQQDLKELSPVRDSVSSEESVPIYVNLSQHSDITNPKINKSSKSVQQKVSAHNVNEKENTDLLISDHRLSQKKKSSNHFDSNTTQDQRQKYSVDKHTISSSIKREGKSSRPEESSKSKFSGDNTGKINGEIKMRKVNKTPVNDKYKKDELKTEGKEHNSRAVQRSSPKTSSEEARDSSRDYIMKNRDASYHRKRNSSKDKIRTVHENIKHSPKQSSDSSPRRSSVQTKTNDKEHNIKANSNKANKHREYVINYDDKNGTVSSICKIAPGLGSSSRRNRSKEKYLDIHKDSGMKIKTVDKVASRK